MSAVTCNELPQELMQAAYLPRLPRALQNGEERKLFLAVPFRAFPSFIIFGTLRLWLINHLTL